MRKGRLFAASVSAVAVAIIACGGSSENAPTGGSNNDAGSQPDVIAQDTNAPDTNAPDVADAAPVCTTDADLQTVAPDDASLGEAGSVGLCMSCAKSKCSTAVDQCQGQCECAKAAACILQNCLASAGDLFSLGSCAVQHGCISLSNPSFPSGATALTSCLQTSCQDECNLIVPDANVPETGGGDSASDAKTD